MILLKKETKTEKKVNQKIRMNEVNNNYTKKEKEFIILNKYYYNCEENKIMKFFIKQT